MTRPIRLLYFAWVREQIGTGSEELELEAPIPLAALLERLRERSAGHAAALAEPARLRAALNGEIAGWEAIASAGDEVAFFPPMTGG